MLEAASVAGREFSANWVAAALDTDVLEVERRCEALARRRLFLDSVKGPAGPERRLAERYRFLHALHQHLLYERLPASRRRRLHRRMENRKRPPSVAAVRTSPPSWPCISRRRETTPERCTISGRRRRMRCGGRPAGRRPICLPGDRATRDVAGDARACPTGAITASEPRGSAVDHPGLYGNRGKSCL